MTGDAERAQVQGAVVRELAVAHQLLSTRLNRALRPLGLSLTSIGMLLHLSRAAGPVCVGDVAAAMEVNQPAVSKTLRTLSGAGAVTVATTSRDARRREVRLTAAGGRLLVRAQQAMHPEATAALAGLDDAALRGLLDLLTRVRTVLDAGRDTGT